MPTISKDALAAIIYKRLNGVVPKASVYDAIGVICDGLSDSLNNGESIVVNNFGVLDTYVYHGHDGVNIASGETQYVKPFISVKFIPHDNLLTLLNRKKSRFRT